MDICAEFSKLFIGKSNYATNKTGFIFDDRMSEHRNLWDPHHPECPERYLDSLQRCKDYGLIDKCQIISPKFADESDLLLVHSKDYVESIKRTKYLNSIADLENCASKYDSIYFHPKTYDSALLSAGCTLELVSSVLNGKIDNGMAVIRPPGHHAMEGEACGYCYFNNVAIAAKHALTNLKLTKILIIDWDVHHGQATQQMFYNDPRVLYFSIHRYEHGAFWPNLRESNFDYTGKAAGLGYNFNVPLNVTGLGNSEYLSIFNNILLPVAYEFCPELVIVSAGYDAALGCREGEMKVTPAAYVHLLNCVSNLASGRICVILEGGYCLSSLSESVALSLRTLLGYPCPKIGSTSEIHKSAIESVLNVITVQRPFWKSLEIQNSYNVNDENDGAEVRHVLDVKFTGNEEKPDSYPTRDCYPVQEPSDVAKFEEQLVELRARTDLSLSQHHTGFIYDVKMTEHVNKRDKRHPEKADRVIKIYEKLQEQELLSKCVMLESREATEAELSLVHIEKYIEDMKATPNMANREVAKLEEDFESIYLCPETYKCALIACGCLLEAVDAVMDKRCTNGFALIRPPGHHAEVGEANGFCIFNSVAIAAKYLISKHGVGKVLIIDWDVHHGNGIQHVFYKDRNVLYISLHLHNGDFFPGFPDAGVEFVGEGDGEGYNINIPWKSTMGDGDYLSAFFKIILPVAYEFNPDFVLVSAGFDAGQNDPLGNFRVSPSTFGIMTKLLGGLSGGNVVMALEGGYNLETLSESVASCIRSLLGQNVGLSQPVKPSENAIKTIQEVVRVHKKFWRCLCFDVDVPEYKPMDDLPLDPNETDNQQLMGNNLENAPVLHLEGAVGNAAYPPLFYCITPIENCPHLELLQPVPEGGLNPLDVCQICGDPNENWVCLQCYEVYCGRFINEHMLFHGSDRQHCLTLSYADLSVWCYVCESYVHNELLIPVKQHAHIQKFGAPF